MTDKVEEQTLEDQEKPPVEQAVISEPEGKQLSQASSQDNVSRAEHEKLVGEIRGLQSKQDKAESGFTNKFIETAQELGMPVSDAQKTELRFRALENDKPTEQGTVSAVPKQEPVDYTQVIEAVGDLNPSDNAVMEVVRKHGDNATDLKAALVDLKLTNNKPPVTTGVVQPNVKQNVSQAIDQTALYTEFEQLKLMPMGDKLPSGQLVHQRRKEIELALQEAEQKG